METITETETHKPLVANRYTLVVMAAKRAKQIKEGAPSLIETESTNSLTIALEEIAAGKINYIEAPETDDDERHASSISSLPRPEPSALSMFSDNLDGIGSKASLDDEIDADADDEADTEADSDTDATTSATEDE